MPLARLVGLAIALGIALALALLFAAGAIGQTTLQSQIDAAGSGGTVNVPSGITRVTEPLQITKPLTLQGSEGSEIRGSEDWSGTGWNRTSSGGNYVYTSSKVTDWGETASPETYCENSTGFQRCKQQAQVFINGIEQTQIARSNDPKCTTLATGQFKVTNERKVVLGCNPANKTVEVTKSMRWAEIQSDGVTIDNIDFAHAAPPPAKGGLENYGHSDVTVSNSDCSYSHAACFNSEGPAGGYSNISLLNNNLHDNGQAGALGSGMNNLVLTGNTVAGNNTQKYDYLWEAGGVKFIGAKGVTYTDNTVQDNRGPGLWCDILCEDGDISGNTVYDSAHSGIMWEVSDGALITQNTLVRNGLIYDNGNNYVFGAGILISSSMNTEVTGNTLAWNNDGISVLEQDRRTDWQTRRAINNYVHDNDILAIDCNNYCFSSSFVDDTENSNGVGVLGSTRLNDASQNNRGDNNRFWYAAAENPDKASAPYRYGWGEQEFEYLDTRGQWPGYNTTPGGGGTSRYLTNAEKDAIVAAKNLPASP